MSDLRPFALALGLALLPTAPALLQGAPAQADSGSVTMDVLGTLSASLDGEADEWLTITGTLDGETGASASWEHMTFDMPGGSDLQSQFMAMAGDQVSEEERRQLEQLGALLGESNPIAEMFGQMMGVPGMGKGMVRISIAGHHPASPNILSEQVLALDVTLGAGADPASFTGQAHPADIQYVAENSSGFLPDVFYVSGEDGHPATVVFERLELEPGGGHASGRFEGSLCRMESARLMEGPDLSDCIRAEGHFDTALVEQ